jgi:uncharacterized ferredoxin-like protein
LLLGIHFTSTARTAHDFVVDKQRFILLYTSLIAARYLGTLGAQARAYKVLVCRHLIDKLERF